MILQEYILICRNTKSHKIEDKGRYLELQKTSMSILSGTGKSIYQIIQVLFISTPIPTLLIAKPYNCKQENNSFSLLTLNNPFFFLFCISEMIQQNPTIRPPFHAPPILKLYLNRKQRAEIQLQPYSSWLSSLTSLIMSSIRRIVIAASVANCPTEKNKIK